MSQAHKWSKTDLDQMQFQADSLADDSVLQVVGDWGDKSEASIKAKFSLFHEAMKLLSVAKANQNLESLNFHQASTAQIQEALKGLVQKGSRLPEWADLKKIERAEQLFEENGLLACVLFFFASLPEVYVIPDVSVVLQATGNLEKATEQRIRSTASMIVAVMMKGGITDPEGSGLAKILKARFIHAVVRNLILRNHPAISVREMQNIPPMASTGNSQNNFERMLFHGWNLKDDGLPCNQDELSYTLMTFSYVFLRSLRRLGLGFSSEDEEAYLHCWNVVGFMMGVRSDLMPQTMAEAQSLFDLMQSRARSQKLKHDPRPVLGRALMAPIQKSISVSAFKIGAQLMTIYLTSPQAGKDLGLSSEVTPLQKMVFTGLIKSILCADQGLKLLKSQSSIMRLLVRVVGYHLILKVLNDPSQPLDLPPKQIDQVNEMIQKWSYDPRASSLMNKIEDRLTTVGPWKLTVT